MKMSEKTRSEADPNFVNCFKNVAQASVGHRVSWGTATQSWIKGIKQLLDSVCGAVVVVVVVVDASIRRLPELLDWIQDQSIALMSVSSRSC